MLVAVIFLLAILMLSLAVAAPSIKKEIQRDREIETMHRGKQFRRAIKLYYKKFNAYPPNLDALVNTNQIRFLRKKYIDPTTGKEEWKPIMFGENKAPMALGFFGVPIGGEAVAGIGPSGGNGLTGSSTSSSALGSSTFGSSTDSGSNSNFGGTGGTGLNAGSSGSTGQTFGGAGIVGFSPNSPKQSILLYKKKNHYNEWEFTYSPLADQMMQGGNLGTIGQPASSTSTPVGGTAPASTSAPTSVSTPAPTPTSQQ
jgi:type II secretory pathway pseudopilin PulG